VKLAVSLNGTTDDQRGAVMPVNRAYPLDRLFAALRKWPLPQGRRITFEYVMLAGINDSLEDAERLHQLTKQLPSTLNLIPFNECPGIDYRRPSPERVAAFREALVANHRVAIVRDSRGQDIYAACGQLRESGGAK
jgi:23S rRNA (adenine2503-C2)-methyltransferase